jgi:lysyl-tRNA synthetase class I
MNKIITWLKRIRLDRIVTVFFAGILLFISTACGTTNALAKTADDARQEVPSKAVTNTYKGGMNDYSDVDARRDTTEAKAKAKALIENAQRNINQKSVDSPDRYADNYRSGTPLGERARRLGEDIGESAEEVTEGAAKGVQKGIQNIKENAQQAPGYLKQTGKETANFDLDEAQTRANNSIKDTRQALDRASETGRSLGNKIQGVAQDTADAVKTKVNRDINRTQRALDNAVDAID